MAIFSTTLANLVERTCKLVLGDWWSGTATGGSTSTIVDANNRNEADDYFNSMPYAEAYITDTTDDAAPVGETRKVSDFVQSSGTITVLDVFTAAVGANDTYSIHSKFKREEVVEAINMAIDMVAEEALFWTVDETTALVAATYEYTLPTSFMYVYQVSMADGDGDYPEPLPNDQWKIIHGSTPKLHLLRLPLFGQPSNHYISELWADSSIVATRTLRIEGLAIPDRLSANSDVTPIAPAYLVFQAGALLWGSKARRNDADPDAARAQMEYWQGRADIERLKVVSMSPPPGSKRVVE